MCSGFSYYYGGIRTVVYKLSELWAKRGHEVYILSGQGRKIGPKGVRVIKLPFIPAKYFQKIPLIARILDPHEFESLSMIPFALLYLIRINPDIILANKLTESLPAFILHFPCVMISQAPIWMRFNAFKKADKVIVNDYQSYRVLKKYGINCELIFNGVEKPNVQETNLEKLRAKYKIPDKSIVILTVARLDSNKRVNLLIEAFRLIKENATLIIVGEGPELPSLKKQASSIKSGNKIIFIKPMPFEQLKELYQLCDVFTLPSKLEGMPLVLLEALSFGKSIVTNPTPEKKFVIDKFGVFANVEDPYDYSKAIIEALQSKIDTYSPSYKQHMQKFDWNCIASQYLEVFHKILCKHVKCGFNSAQQSQNSFEIA
jgi:glycosyltransferase involved in cell wall biosynthesis